jgi:outer membrane protein TolC
MNVRHILTDIVLLPFYYVNSQETAKYYNQLRSHCKIHYYLCTKLNHLAIMKQFFLFALGLFIAFSSSSAAQQSTDTLSFSLDEAMHYASTHAFQKISSDYDVASAKKKIWETIASGLPQIDASAQYNHSIDVPVSLLPAEIIPEEMRPPGIGIGDKVPISFSTAYDANYSVSVSQMVFDGSYFVGLQATQVFLDLTRQQNEKTEIEIRDAVAKAYFLVLSARANAIAFENNLEVNQTILSETEALFENGFRESLDVSQIELMVRQAEKQLLEAVRNETIARSVLRFTMGLDEDQPIKLNTEFDKLSSQALNAKEKNQEWIAQEHIDFRIANTNTESQELQLKNIRAQYLPKINAFYTFQKTGYDEEWNIFNEEWYKAQFIGLSVSVPIFSSGMRHAQAQQQKLAWEKSKNQRTQALRNIKTQSLTALTEYNSAIEEYKELANEIYRKIRTKFSNGMASSFELTQQQGQYIQAQINHVRSTLALLNARINFLRATGKL